ncbi:hypothetical protein CHU32_10160 [Superficieibacter electus]|uniref:Lipoprotein n=1 Tax=Superficieibacter electus TaxID=2022662 RepID=A0A2P5GQW9_9ENTR|nr:hypothetical protein [Superficieibacter electus]POP43432.1 hypothetical protein CHU33_16275 [Superficieibacter electus]POP48947.1 hypothetical protein CHU32_10160 [Superficieibacter electus]
MKLAVKAGLSGAIILALTACDSLDPTSTKGEFHYSNPTTTAIAFKVDDKDYTVEPGATGQLSLSPGMHTMVNAKGEKNQFMVFENNTGGIINPERQMYYMLSEVYAVKGHEKRFRPAEYAVTINGHNLKMPLLSANAAIIDHNFFACKYQLGEPFPDNVTTLDKNTEGNIFNKCFDKTELLTYFEKEYDQKLPPSAENGSTEDSVNTAFDYRIPEPKFKDAETQKQAEKIVALLKQINDSTDPDVHEDVRKALFQATSDLVSADVKVAAKNSVEDNKYYNAFVEQTGNFAGYGILPK